MTKTRALVGALAILFLVAVVTVVVAVQAANHADRLATAIQVQRVTNTLANCNDQNARHDNTIMALNHLIAASGRKFTPAQAQAQAAPIVLLIDALAPKRNCTAYVRATTGMR